MIDTIINDRKRKKKRVNRAGEGVRRAARSNSETAGGPRGYSV